MGTVTGYGSRGARYATLMKLSTVPAHELLYEPVVCLQTGRVVGAEVVPVGHGYPGVVTPAEVTAGLRDWTLATAIYQVNAWCSASEKLPLTLNLPPELVGRDFRERLGQLLGKEIRSGYVEVAMSASALTPLSKVVRDDLLALNSSGVSLTLTDVDTYGPLDLLGEVEFSTVKLAGYVSTQLGDTLTGAHHSACLVRVVQEMTAMLDFKVVATGVQTRDQLAKYHSLGCAFAQGPYLGGPLDADMFGSFYLSTIPLPLTPGLKPGLN